MKNSILVAVIATATMLSACGSKNESPAVTPAGKVSAKTQKDLNNSTWISSCVNQVTSPSMVGAGSQQTRLQFISDDMIQVTAVDFTSTNCTGEAVDTPDALLLYSATAKGNKISAQINESTTVKSGARDNMIELGASVGRFSIVIKDIQTLVIKAVKVDGIDALSGVYTREVAPRGASERYGDFGVPTDATAPQKAIPYMYNSPKAPKGTERF